MPPLELRTVRPLSADVLGAKQLDALLHSNEPPEEFNIQRIQTLISNYNDDLDVLDNELSWLNQQLPVLEDLQAEFQSYPLRSQTDDPLGRRISSLQERCVLLETRRATIAKCAATNYSSILSPLRRMPPEILREIMKWTIPTANELLIGSGGVSLRQSPWNIACVSRRWRAIALSMPSLWSSVVWDYSRYRLPLEAIKLQVKRADRLRVLHHPLKTEGDDNKTAVQTLEYLVEHSPRWEESALRLTSETVHLLPALQDRIPSLRRLSISCADEESERMTRSLDWIKAAPSLVELVVYRGHHPLSPPLVSPNQLTHYYAHADWATHRGILSFSPSLIQAFVGTCVKFTQGWPQVGEPIRLARLRRLAVSDVKILSYLSVPVLEHLGIQFRHASRWTEMSGTLEGFLTTYSSSIHTVVLKGICNAKVAREILTRVPATTELVFIVSCKNQQSHPPEKGPTISDKLATLLSRVEGSCSDPERGPTLICPRLTHFNLVFGSGYPFKVDYHVLLQALHTRLSLTATANPGPGGSCALRAVTVACESSSPRQVQKPWLKALRGLKELGGRGLEFSYVEGASAKPRIDDWTCHPAWREA